MLDQHDLISVVIATYNRSNVLRFAIETVLMQTYSNWELIIVGDCCTDDTEEVIESFKNEKIRFINLEKILVNNQAPIIIASQFPEENTLHF
jgi:glycosyltransferase involved in cell wall biosynthesis